MMEKLRKHSRGLALILAVFLLGFNVQAAVAGMIGNEQLAMDSAIESKRGEIEVFMARADIASALQQYGVDADDVKDRVANLSDAEVLEIHDKLAELPAGQDFLVAVIGIIVIFMLLDMAGVTDIFPAI